MAIETPSLAGGGHRNPLAGRGWPSKPPRWPGVAIETPRSHCTNKSLLPIILPNLCIIVNDFW